jgi:hypothetical protein
LPAAYTVVVAAVAASVAVAAAAAGRIAESLGPPGNVNY